MKNLFIISILLVISVISCTQFEFEDGIITRYTGLTKKVVIPEEINGERVTAIGKRAFYIENLSNKKGINSIILPNTITSIEEEAFFNNELTTINLPKNITFIGERAFYLNFKLNEVTIGNNIELGRDAFPDGFVEYYNGNGKINGIYMRSFNRPWSSLAVTQNKTTSVNSNKNIIETIRQTISPASDFIYDLNETEDGVIILEYAGKGGYVNIPETIEGYPVVAIGREGGKTPFRGSLEYFSASKDDYVPVYGNADEVISITIPNSVKSIGGFAMLPRLEKVTLPEGLEEIPRFCFIDLPELKEINIPNSVRKIGDSAFYLCGKIPLATRSIIRNINPKGYDMDK
jgi:hypothetical protein